MLKKNQNKKNTETKPVRRSESLKQISREHHHGLLLCWKIRAGLKKDIAPERIKAYAGWFCQQHLLPHFEIEEKYVFPVLGTNHPLIRKALTEHRRLKRLFAETEATIKNLSLIEEELDSHIRFEERILFNKIQEVATEEQMSQIQLLHTEEGFEDNLKDAFWL